MTITGKFRRSRRSVLRYSGNAARVRTPLNPFQSESRQTMLSNTRNILQGRRNVLGGELPVTPLENEPETNSISFELPTEIMVTQNGDINEENVMEEQVQMDMQSTDVQGISLISRQNVIRTGSQSSDVNINLLSGLSHIDSSRTENDEENVCINSATECDNSTDGVSNKSHQSGSITHWTEILALVLVTGSVKFTRTQYDTVRILVMCLGYEKLVSSQQNKSNRDERMNPLGLAFKNPLPCYKTVQRSLRPAIEEKLGARFYDIVYNHNTKVVTRVSLGSEIDRNVETKVRIVPISEYARLDVSFPKFLSASSEGDKRRYEHFTQECLSSQGIQDGNSPGSKHWDCVDDWNLIANRTAFYSDGDSIHALRDSTQITCYKTMNRAYVGDTISFQCKGTTQLSQFISTVFTPNERSTDSVLKIAGRITSIEIISTLSSNTESLQNRANSGSESPDQCTDTQSQKTRTESDKNIMQKLSNLLQNGNHIASSENSSKNGRKQLFGAGDILATVRPVQQNDEDVILILVNRFNVPPGEYDEHVFGLRIGNNRMDQTDSSRESIFEEPIDEDGNIIVDVHEVRVTNTSNQDSASQKVRASTGELADGSSYFVYRFVLFWDAFRVSDAGSQSVDGVYMIPLNLPPRYRSSSSSVRVLSLFPKSVPASIVLDEFLVDIKRGMTRGISDYDANGNKVTIFLDIVACIGDTPAINEMLDVRGHTAIACCHLCRFRRNNLQVDLVLGKEEEKLFKPRYMNTEVHGGKSFASRSLTAHTSLQAHELDQGTKKRLGIQLVSSLPFSNYQREFKSIAQNIPLTSEGVSVIPSSFHCYRGLLIGPDHLLYGLAKNCLSAVLKLLPDERYIVIYEKDAKRTLAQARIPTQRNLVNSKNRTLLPMSISEVFALLVVSEFSFYRCIMVVEGLPLMKENKKVSHSCLSAIKLVTSFASLASRLWFRPRLEEDGIESTRKYNAGYGSEYMRETQGMIEDHVKQMRTVCTYDNEDLREYNALKNKRGKQAKIRRDILQCKIQDAMTITKELDCPNVHRLLELGHVYLPMIGSITRITDLEFERCHQALKRAIEQSNNKDTHTQAVSSAIYNDWQGRLSMLLGNGSESHEDLDRCLFRLLFGREAVIARDGNLSSSDKESLTKAVGPNLLIEKLLQKQGRTVMNEEIGGKESLYWMGRPRKDAFVCTAHISGDHPFSYDLSNLPDQGVIHSELEPISTLYKQLVSQGRQLLDSVYGCTKWTEIELAYPKHHGTSNRKRKAELLPGDIMQCIGVPSSGMLPVIATYSEYMPPAYAQKSHYYILFLFTLEDACGAVVLPCHEASGCNDQLSQRGDRLEIPQKISYKLMTDFNDVKIMKLTSSCQRVLVQHRCTRMCFAEEMWSPAEHPHGEHPLEAVFYIQNRERGFPPRAA